MAGKLINNMLVCVHLMAATEAVRLGVQAGVDPALLVEMLKTATGTSTMVRAYRKIDRVMDVGEHYRPDGVWQLVQKDVHLALDFARQRGAAMPIADLVGKLYDDLEFGPGRNPFAP